MSKKHDENKNLRLISRIAKIDIVDKTIQAPKSANIGIRTWGRIDFLTNYCGWHFIYNNDVHITPKFSSSDKPSNYKREAKKLAKENTLTDKRKKR